MPALSKNSQQYQPKPWQQNRQVSSQTQETLKWDFSVIILKDLNKVLQS